MAGAVAARPETIMKPARFAYVRPDSVAEAVAALAEHGEDARVIAGGQSLGAMLNMRLVTPKVLVDINALADLAATKSENDALITGATVCQSDALTDPQVRAPLPLLAQALPYVGHYQTRNRGTLGGSVAHADPSAEIPLVLATLGGDVELSSKRGRRRVPAQKFFQSALVTARRPDELLMSLRWPARRSRQRFAFTEFAVRSGDYAIVAVACVLDLNEEGALRTVRLGFGGAAEVPQIIDLPDVNERLDAKLIQTIALDAAARIHCRGDLLGSVAYRRQLAGVLAARAIASAFNSDPHPEERAHVSAPAYRRMATSARPAFETPGQRPGSSGRGPEVGRWTITFTLNGRRVSPQAEPRMQVADLLRHVLHQPGTHVGCEHGICGACTILVDGRALRSCLLFAAQVEGASITTVEGLAQPDDDLNDLQKSFRHHHALQCGFCTTGILASATQFLTEHPNPSEHEVREMLSGHLCRCTGYQPIVEAILATARERRELESSNL
jgi:xanthine dehydrogenase iron-sulfur cluster and FAD-binding subunit A